MATSASNEKSLHSCANCGRNATKSCGACYGTPDGNGGQVETTWYCGLECQKNHWSSHKIACKAMQERKILYRAGDTVQLLFYMYREIVFDKLIAKVEKKENEILLYEGFYEDDCIIPFPAAYFPGEREKQAMLTYMACDDAVGYMHEVLKVMVKGVSSHLLEIAVDAWNYKPLKLRLFQFCGEEDQRCPPHQVLRITLKNGEIYIIDLAGAQYGHYESVVPVDTYFQTRAGSVLERRTFGHQQRLLKQACGAPTWRGAILDCNEQFHRGLNLSIDEWQKENVSLDGMLNLAEKHFLQRQRHLIAFVDEKLREYKEWAEIGGLFKICKVADVEASHWIET